MIDQKTLKHLLHYDAETGLFTWKNPPRGKTKGQVAGTNSKGYVRIFIKGKGYLAHRLAYLYLYGSFPKKEIDHANGDRSDNRICNIREATRSQNCANKKTGSGEMKGCYWNGKRKLWIVQIKKDGIKKTVGRYKTADEAKKAYAVASNKEFGDYALNCDNM